MVVVVEASLSPSWTKAMLQGGPRVSVIPCYRSWVGWPAQHSTALPNTQPWFLCRNDLGGCACVVDVRAECGSFLPQSVVLITVLYSGHNEATVRTIQCPGSQWTFTVTSCLHDNSLSPVSISLHFLFVWDNCLLAINISFLKPYIIMMI